MFKVDPERDEGLLPEQILCPELRMRDARILNRACIELRKVTSNIRQEIRHRQVADA